jgi:hypothetical protein
MLTNASLQRILNRKPWANPNTAFLSVLNNVLDDWNVGKLATLLIGKLDVFGESFRGLN